MVARPRDGVSRRRLKNTLVMVQSIADHTLRSGDVADATRQALNDRLIALSEAHNVLVEQNWAEADLHAVVGRALAPHFFSAGHAALRNRWPASAAQPAAGRAMSMVLNELCTDAIKYGALSIKGGAVHCPGTSRMRGTARAG
jgi:two-component sensor histidine kinase